MAAKRASRVRDLFDRTVRLAAARFPGVKGVKMRWCRDCDAAHRKAWRNFAHSLHHPGVVCFARAAERDLTDDEIIGIGAHELGHVVSDALGLPAHRRALGKPGKTPRSVQDEADVVAEVVLGIPIRYNKRTLEEVAW